LTELDLHGPVYFDNQFGSLALDPIGQKVAFVAEKKRPNASPFFKPGGSNGSTLPGGSVHFSKILEIFIFRKVSKNFDKNYVTFRTI
jgi:hypothetical protein